MTEEQKPARDSGRDSGRRDAGRPRGEPVLENILQRTLEEIAAHGPQGASIDRIAKAAEVNKTSIYRRWPTRESLISAALERVASVLALEIADTGSLRGDVASMAQSIAAWVQSPQGRALALAAAEISSTAIQATNPTIAAGAAQILESQASDPMRALVARAESRGEWRQGVAPQMLLAVLVGAVLHRTLIEHQKADAVWIEQLVDLVCGGLVR